MGDLSGAAVCGPLQSGTEAGDLTARGPEVWHEFWLAHCCSFKLVLGVKPFISC